MPQNYQYPGPSTDEQLIAKMVNFAAEGELAAARDENDEIDLVTFIGGFKMPLDTGRLNVSGVGFAPKVIFFFPTIYPSFKTQLGAGAHLMFGVAISGTDRRCIAANSENNQVATDTVRRQDNAHIFTRLAAGGPATILYDADYVGEHADGFIINCTTVTADEETVGFLALGGEGITNVVTGAFQSQAATGNQDVTLGFRPDLVIFFNIAETSAGPASLNQLRFNMGWANGDSEQCAFSTGEADAVTPSAPFSYQRGDKAFVQISQAGALQIEGTMSDTVTGFRMNWTTNNAAAYIYYVAIKGITTKIGTFNTKDSVGDFYVSGNDFKPLAGMYFSCNRPTSTSIAEQINACLGAGAEGGIEQQMVLGAFVEDAKNPTHAQSFLGVRRINQRYNLASEALISELRSRCGMAGTTMYKQMVAETQENEICYLLIGEADPTT